MAKSSAQCQGLRPSLPAVLYSEGNVPVMKTDEQPGELRGVIGKGEIDYRGKSHHTQDTADPDRQEVADVFHEFNANVGEETQHGFVNTENHREPRRPRARAQWRRSRPGRLSPGRTIQSTIGL